MCVEWHSRFRRCGHTRFLRWDYCTDVQTDVTAQQCPRYECKFRDNQETYNCFECIKERAPRGYDEGSRQNSTSTGTKSNDSRVGNFFRRVLSCG